MSIQKLYICPNLFSKSRNRKQQTDVVRLFGVLLICIFFLTRNVDEAFGQSCNISQQIVASDLEFADWFGRSIDVNGDVAIVGAPLHGARGDNSGAAYIYRWSGTSWLQETKLLGSDIGPGDSFGGAVSIDGNIAVVVAHGKYINGTQTGATYIFRRNGSNWIEEQKFPVGFSGTPDLVNSAVSISGNVIVVGSSSDRTRGLYAGAAHLIFWNGSTWILPPKLTALDAANVDFFGFSVAAFGDWVLIGSFADDDRGSASGSAYLFKRNDNGTPLNLNDDFWEQKQKIVPPDGTEYDQFGYGVDINNDMLIIGANQDGVAENLGSAYIYRLIGSTWTYEDEIHSSGSISNGYFGLAVSIAGDTAIIGAPQERPFWTNGGAVYVFQKSGSTWNETSKLADPNAGAGNYFGYSVSISGSAIFASSYKALGTGAAYSFSCASSAPTIASSSPLNGYVDPLEDRDATTGVLLGVKDISITFSSPVTNVNGAALSIANFERKYFRNNAEITGAPYDLAVGTAPTVTLVSGSGAGPYLIRFSPRIPLGAWTQIRAINVIDAAASMPISSTENRIVIGSLPMDITQDGKVLGDDINRWLAISSNSFDPTPLTKLLLLDQKRNAIVAGEDITRAIQLLEGTSGTTFRVWGGFDMGAKP